VGVCVCVCVCVPAVSTHIPGVCVRACTWGVCTLVYESPGHAHTLGVMSPGHAHTLGVVSPGHAHTLGVVAMCWGRKGYAPESTQVNT
jgi:hypothetical protein